MEKEGKRKTQQEDSEPIQIETRRERIKRGNLYVRNSAVTLW